MFQVFVFSKRNGSSINNPPSCTIHHKSTVPCIFSSLRGNEPIFFATKQRVMGRVTSTEESAGTLPKAERGVRKLLNIATSLTTYEDRRVPPLSVKHLLAGLHQQLPLRVRVRYNMSWSLQLWPQQLAKQPPSSAGCFVHVFLGAPAISEI
ncbi:hypothetical protein BV898_03530 [Hypsibius exemplaris]|uniref:Uncharacterized protein n=1 Tax=Hypsibius exemplaris TaxID=2072580 RepID=A0A1W0X5U1_HYPEX|nr:hypothetical protein BV898_03530 [Hypsibius exemplaris]